MIAFWEFFTSKIGLCLIGVAAALAALAIVYGKGEQAGRTGDAIATIRESEDARKLREKNDTGARSLDNDAALVCLRNPGGCRR